MTPAPTPSEVDAALAVLSPALPHDPPERWLSAYQTLRRAKADIDRAYRPAFVVKVLAVLAALGFAFTPFEPENYLLKALILFGGPALVGAIADFITAQLKPLVRQLIAIENAIRPFSERASLQQHVGT